MTPCQLLNVGEGGRKSLAHLAAFPSLDQAWRGGERLQRLPANAKGEAIIVAVPLLTSRSGLEAAWQQQQPLLSTFMMVSSGQGGGTSPSGT